MGLNKPEAALRDLTEANRFSQDGLCVDSIQEPLVKRGDLYFWLGDYQRASADYSTVLKHRHMSSKELPIMLFLANRHLGQTDTDTLKASLSKLVSDERVASFVGWSTFDDTLQSTLLGNDNREALLAAARSSDTETNAAQLSEAYFILGELEALRGDLATARADFQQSEQFDRKGLGMFAKAQASRLPAASILRESFHGGVVSRPISPAGHYYALVIGISSYPGTLRLDTPRADATAIGDILQRMYGFQVKALLDGQATRSGILRAVKEYRNQLRPEDSLLIYYAGHGQSDKQADKAYWLPIDADSADSPNAIIADELTASVRTQAANHVLVIADSCFSGDLTRDPNFPVPALVTAAYLEQMQARKSRTLMASGGDEPVSDGGGNGHFYIRGSAAQGA